MSLSTTFRRSISTAPKLFCACCLALAVVSMAAQTPSPKLSTNTFSASEQATLTGLQKLASLPDGSWQMHTGDIPHGEDPTLDTSSWPTASMPLDTEEGTVWFRRWFTAPADLNGYSLRGVRIGFQFGAFAHGGIQQIVYFNGRRVALGESLEPITLLDSPKPDERILIAVKLLHSAGSKHVTHASLPITFAAARPNPVMLREECVSAATLLPMLSGNSGALAGQQTQLREAVAAIDMPALATGDQNTFDASLRHAQAELEPLRPVLQQAALFLVGQSHMDAAWLWPWTETVDTVHRTFFTTLQLMEEYPKFRYAQSAMQYYAWMEEKFPDIFAQIQQRIREGRWEVVGGMWVEPDFNLPDGETTVRELLLGKDYARQQLGVDVRVGWNPDSFGFSWQLPQIYKKSGVDYFMTQKMAWNDANQLPLKLFWWQSPDGSRVLAYFAEDQNSSFHVAPLVGDLTSMHKFAPGSAVAMPLFGVGDHGGGVTRTMLDAASLWAASDVVFPKTTFSTAQQFFENVAPLLETPVAPWNYRTLAAGQTSLPAPDPGQIEVPVWNDELYLEFHRGTYTTQAQQKKHMRESEEQMLNAEKLSSLAWLDGQSYPETALRDAWKKVTFNGFHDLAAGSGTANIYVDAERDFDSIREVAGDASRAGLADLEAHADTQGSGAPIFVFNPLAWNRTGMIEADVQLPSIGVSSLRLTGPDGKELPVQVLSSDPATGRAHILALATVPSMGYSVLHAQAGVSTVKSSLSVHGTTLENKLLRVEVDPHNGCITHVIDKRSGFDSIAAGGCGNQLQTFTDNPKKYDAWNIDAVALTTMKPITAADSVEVIDRGPLRASIRVKRHFGTSTFSQDIVLYDGVDRVDIENDIDWHATHVLLKASFPLAATSPMATYEIPYGTIDRPTTRNNPVDAAKYEVPALRWADEGDGNHGLSLLNDSKYGYDAVGNLLRLSLLRSPVYPDPDADRGHHHFSYALYPHSGTWQQALTMRRGWEFNYPLRAIAVTPHQGPLGAQHSFVQFDDDGVVLTAMKQSEDRRGLVLRLYDWSGKTSEASLALPGHPTRAEEGNLMEKPSGTPIALTGSTLRVSFSPYEIKTLLVSYPSADAATPNPSTKH